MTDASAHSPRTPDGYRHNPLTTSGPRIRADVVDVYIFRTLSPLKTQDPRPKTLSFLQLLRAKDPLSSTWQPIMGHVEHGETATDTARRELTEEVSLDSHGTDVLGFWALEQIWPFYIAQIDCVVLSPRFAVEVTPTWEPTLNPEHTAHRWITVPADHNADETRDTLDAHFMWPGQRHTITEILRDITRENALPRERLRIK